MFTVSEEYTEEVWSCFNTDTIDKEHKTYGESVCVKGKTKVPHDQGSYKYTYRVAKLEATKPNFANGKANRQNNKDEKDRVLF